MTATSHRHPDPHRKTHLAKIHIAKKDLRLEDDAYRQIIRDVGGARSGSAGDLNESGRKRVLDHFKTKGWEPKHKSRPRITRNNEILANRDQISLIRHIWIRMAEDGAVKAGDEAGLRAWVRAATRRYHPQRAGYSAPEFMPNWVAINTIEQLKKWAERCEVEWH